MKITEFSEALIELMTRPEFDSFEAKPYLCPAGVPTIGFGCTFYEDGRRVSMTDEPITLERAKKLLAFHLQTFAKYVDTYTRDDINQHQFDALGDFVYNLGVGNLKTSTLLKKVNANPNDPTIRDEFMKWNKAGGKALKGLTKRRKMDADLYFS